MQATTSARAGKRRMGVGGGCTGRWDAQGDGAGQLGRVDADRGSQQQHRLRKSLRGGCQPSARGLCGSARLTEIMISLSAGSPRRIIVSRRSGAKSGSLRQWPALSSAYVNNARARHESIRFEGRLPESAARISGRQNWEFVDGPAYPAQRSEFCVVDIVSCKVW